MLLITLKEVASPPMALFNSTKKFFPWVSFFNSKTSFVWSSVRIWNRTTPIIEMHIIQSLYFKSKFLLCMISDSICITADFAFQYCCNYRCIFLIKIFVLQLIKIIHILGEFMDNAMMIFNLIKLINKFL